MQHAMFGQRLWHITVPFGVIGLSLVGIIACAIIAALWPATRAARTDVLTAIAST